MNQSSVEALRNSFNRLAGYIDNRGDGYASPLACAGINARQDIVNILVNANPTLANAWKTVGDFCFKLDDAMHKNVDEFAKALTVFCEQAYSNEGHAIKAAETANTQAEAILKELGL